MSGVITPSEFKNKLEELNAKYEGKDRVTTELRHIRMDALLVETLISLGYNDGIEIYIETYMEY